MISVDDYARAERLLWPVLAGTISNGSVSPRWLGDTDTFWYRRDTNAGHEYVVVDAATGATRPLFDHAGLAQILSASFGESTIAAVALPLDDLVVSPNRSSFTFRVGENAYRADLELISCERLAISKAPRALSVSLDSRWAVLTRNGNIWLRNLLDGAERALTSDGRPEDGYAVYPDTWMGAFISRRRFGEAPAPFGVEWSPDSSRLILPRIDQRHVPHYPFVESTPQDGSFRPKLYQPRIPLVGERPALVTWHVFDVPSGAHRLIELPSDLSRIHELATQSARWSADGRCHYFLAQGRNMSSAALFEVDLASGAARPMIEEHLRPRTPLNGMVYNPPNVWLSKDAREAIWYSQRDGRGHLYLYDTACGEPKAQITKGDWSVRDLIAVDASKREILFTGSGRESGNPYHRQLYRVNFDGSGLVRLTHGPLDHEIAPPQGSEGEGLDLSKRQVSPSGKYIVHGISSADHPPCSVIRELGDGRVVALFEEADVNAAVEAGYRPPHPFSVTAADGVSDLWGVLYLPSRLDPSAPCPLIVSQYATPIGPASPKTFIRAMAGSAGPVTPAALASLGFAVMSLDSRGTGLRSHDIDHAIDGRLNVIGMDDYVAAIKQIGDRYPSVDTGRVGIYGGSFGGFAVIRAMLEYPDVFKVGVASSPPAAFHNMYPDFHWFAYHGEPVYADGSPWRPEPAAVPVNYENVNANVQTERLQGKLLIIFGELDENVLPASPLQFIAALIEDDRPFDMLLLPNACHSTISRTRHFVRRHLDYFVEHLLGADPPSGFRFSLLGQSPESVTAEGAW